MWRVPFSVFRQATKVKFLTTETSERRRRRQLLLDATRNTQHVFTGAWLFVSTLLANTAEIDLSKLPPAAAAQVEFDRDVRPMLQQSCLRCHGPEKPKSGFRLDERNAALKGGNNNPDDIVPGDSARSKLIHYVTRLVEDMEMPPAAKGDPLTPGQISLLRAWIDQGAAWGATQAVAQTTFSLTPGLRWIGVSGDEQKFRELEGVKAGWAGGLEHFSMEDKLGADRKFTAEGRVLFDEHDAQLRLALTQRDVGFVRAGLEQWRRYYGDTGGFSPRLPDAPYHLNRDFHLDLGRAWIDFGLTRPGWPQMVFGYEYQFKEGAKSTLQWGAVEAGYLGLTNNVYPAAKNIDEHTHLLKFDLTHEWRGWLIEDNARVEWYDLQTRRDNPRTFTLGLRPDTTERAQERYSHVQGANSIRVEKQLYAWWLWSGGYLFSKLEGDSRLNQFTLDANFLPAPGQFWSTEAITLRRDSHVFSLANLLLPFDGLSATAGFQSEWTHQEGFGDTHLDAGDPNMPSPAFLHPATISADLDKTKTQESAGLRFTRIPRSIVFGEARLEQERLGQYERQDAAEAHDSFLRDTDAANDRTDLRAGFNTSPWPWLSFTAHYRWRESDSEFNHHRDESPDPTEPTLPNEGYSAFISARRIQSDEVLAKLVLRPLRWFKTTLTYQLAASDYFTETAPLSDTNSSPGGRVFAGNYDANIYSANLTLTPFQRLYFSGTFSYTETRTATAHRDNASIATYRGDINTLMASASYIVNAATDLQAAYVFSRAGFGQANYDDGLPLGLDYTRHGLMLGVSRQFNERVTANLRYAFYAYDEPTSGGANDYTAHGVFATMTYKWQ